jgi:hypothetical protein
MSSFLFIPGTGGVNFRDADGTPSSYVVEIITARWTGWTDRIVRELSCEHPAEVEAPWPPLRTSLLDGTELEPDRVLFASAYPAIPQAKYAPFAYD